MVSNSSEYEKLVQEIHESLLKNDGVENIKVLRNVKITGKSGAVHEIDVYWKFKLAGVIYKTCIECKQYNSTVKKSHIASFSAILNDIGNATGIFASTVGFQKGAILFAKENQIRLILVNNLLKTVNISLAFLSPEITILGVEFDSDQAKEKLFEHGLSHYSCEHNWHQDTFLYDQGGSPTTTLKKLIDGIPAVAGEGILNPVDIYDKTDIGFIKIQSIKYRVDLSELKSNQEIQVNDISRAIIEDVLESYSYYLNDDGSIAHIGA